MHGNLRTLIRLSTSRRLRAIPSNQLMGKANRAGATGPSRSLRRLVKSAAEVALTTSGGAALARRMHSHDVAILAYHNVVPDAEAGRGDVSLHLPFSRFLRHLDELERTHTFVHLPEAMSPVRGGRIRAVVTFDDAYRGAVNLALPELRRRGIPATVFVCPGLLDETGLWWDELAQTGRLDPATRHHAMFALKGDLAAVRRWAPAPQAAPALPETFGVATEAELLNQLVGGITAGAHSWSHACLPALDPQDLRSDLVRTLAWLEAFPAPTIPWLALPYGEGTDAVSTAALEVGYEDVMRIRGGLCPPGAPPGWIPRINVPAGMSSRGLALRASGLLK